VAATLADLATSCGPDRPAAVCRELTKIHEEFVRGTLAQLADAAADGRIKARGEFAIVVGQGAEDTLAGSEVGARAGARDDTLTKAKAEVAELVAAGVARGEAARRVARARSVSRRLLYDAPDEGGGRPGA
jgi:16S rRNA (cytidine1402-2'-O)-methyltransferase